ncbi:hypothetical protein TNCV_1226431 [Trichonephila clavipes]|nr:hypothetical protein TNCV_1226431 [Trichonephila clavipes]
MLKKRILLLKKKSTSYEKQFQSQKKEFDSELKNKDQKLAKILKNSEKFTEAISEEKDEMLLDLQNQLKTKKTEINLSSQVKKSNQELGDMTENDELKIMHEKKLLPSKKSQEKSSE